MTLYLPLPSPDAARLLLRDLEAREATAGLSPLRQAILRELAGLLELSEPPEMPKEVKHA